MLRKEKPHFCLQQKRANFLVLWKNGIHFVEEPVNGNIRNPSDDYASDRDDDSESEAIHLHV